MAPWLVTERAVPYVGTKEEGEVGEDIVARGHVETGWLRYRFLVSSWKLAGWRQSVSFHR